MSKGAEVAGVGYESDLIPLLLLYLLTGKVEGGMRMFDHLFTVETLLVVLSVWGAGVAFYLLKTYLQRVNVYHARVQHRIMKIGSQPLGQEERQNP